MLKLFLTSLLLCSLVSVSVVGFVVILRALAETYGWKRVLFVSGSLILAAFVLTSIRFGGGK